MSKGYRLASAEALQCLIGSTHVRVAGTVPERPQRPIRKPRLSKRGDKWSDYLADQCRLARLKPPLRNYQFALELGRRWELDLAWPVAVETPTGRYRGFGVEVDGCVHGIQAMRERDIEKAQAARKLGWDILRVSTRQVRSGEAIGLVIQVLNCGPVRSTEEALDALK